MSATDAPATGASGAPRDSWWPVSLREAGLLLGAALLATGLSWFLRGDGLPLVADPTGYELELSAPLVGIDEALDLYDEGEYIFVDVRSGLGEDYETIPGAFFIRQDTFDDDLLNYFDFMRPEDHFVLFGDGNLLAASNIAARMQERGFENVAILKGGLEAWRNGGGDISRRTGDGS